VLHEPRDRHDLPDEDLVVLAKSGRHDDELLGTGAARRAMASPERTAEARAS